MATVLSAPDQRVILKDVSWETYQHLLADNLDRSVPHFTFDHGVLEIMSPSAEHEQHNRTIALFVEVVAEEMNLDIVNLGSTTFSRRDLQSGFEPDSCFYIRSASRIRGKSKIDLTTDPAPELVIEIDITSPSIKKFPIYARLGVPEVWQYDGSLLRIFKLDAGEYREVERSGTLPRVTAAALMQFLEASKNESRPDWLRSVRDWIRKGG